MNEQIIRAAVTIVGGALAGGLTNTVAIWMLFHPHTPPKLFGWRLRFLHGAVPRSQPRLAAAIGRTVGNQLLTQDDLTRVFAQSEFRAAFDARMEQFLHDLFEVERGSLREILGPEVMVEADRLAQEIVGHALAKLDEHVRTAAFASAVESRAQEFADFLAAEPAGDILTPERATRLATAADSWLESLVASENFRGTVSTSVARAAESVLKADAAVEDLLPLGVSEALERAVAGYLPLAIGRLGALLEDPAVRERLEQTVQELLQRFLGDLQFHKRVVARLLVTERTVKRILNALKQEGTERMAAMLKEAPAQRAMAKSIREAVRELLQRPVSEVLGKPDDSGGFEAREAIAAWLVDVARDPTARKLVTDALTKRLAAASEGTWGELVGGVEPERLSQWVVAAARSELAGTVYRETAQRLVTATFDRPIGRPARFLPANAVKDTGRVLGDPLWRWLQSQIPSVVQRLDIAARVEEKVVAFPLEKMEKMVRSVSERELRTIIRLGYALGAFVGTLLVAVNYLLG